MALCRRLVVAVAIGNVIGQPVVVEVTRNSGRSGPVSVVALLEAKSR
jgi:hypothetical protein